MSKQDEVDIEASSAPLIEHLIELRQRLMWAVGGFFIAFLFCFFWAKDLFNFLVLPFKWAVIWAGMDHRKVALIYTAPQEFFFTQIKIAMFGGLILAFPVIAAQVYKFIAPGLYRNERKAFLPFLVASPLLFLLGATLVYTFFMPMVMWFFLAMEQTGGEGQVDISLLPKVSEYLGLIMTLIFAFGLVFQLPVVTTLLARAGLATSDGLREKRKYAIVFAFITAAILTPPDPVSQIGLALPTILLYEISIYTARLVERERAEREQDDEDEDETPDPEPQPPEGGSSSDEADLEEQGRGSMP
ncbi:twin-arginine translocase subunit TatC [Zhengella mangrovi]|uniref:Sec-independent protein translocase protein TatC n=1 Tax=Zhengella mangrovi TaxID=1982044 RepID=A0A2G1QR26_9HYPH|nr:twin-arginine translocase subunit TatC [Zhengella mangrovi]PHP67976.1 twin-arginine translocase subunit TatC [Zhengella mangrovi]